METRASYLLVGGFVLALMAALFVFVIWLAKSSFEEPAQRYLIYFTGSVTGLQEGSPVRFRGISIGTVSDIRIAPNNVEQVQVTIEVPPGTPIKRDTIAALETQGITGGAYVQLSGGTQGSPDLAAEADGLPVIQSQPSSLAEVFEAAPQLLNNLIGLTARVAGLITPENERAIGEILENARVASERVAGGSQSFDETLRQLASTVGTVNGLVTDLRTDAERLTDRADATLAQAQQTMGSVGGSAEKATTEFARTATELRTLTGSLKQASDQLAGLVKENREPIRDFTGSGLYEFNLLITDLRSLVSTLSRVTTRLERSPGDFLFGSRRGVETQ
jgi:phospholipid/cholesterol/gamma-HCH transport system substrate-binding protein